MTPITDLTHRAPAWAASAEARLVAETDDGMCDAYDLFRDGAHVGCMYDLGAGYVFEEGVEIVDGHWEDTPLEGLVA